MDKKNIKLISEAAGKDNIFTAPEDLACYAYDAGRLESIPEAVVLPVNKKQVSDIITICNEKRIAVYPRGSGSGTTGASTPSSKGIVISTARMNRIVSISGDDLQAVVEPGVITGVLQSEVEKKGLFYPPDPASLNFCTLGGNVSTGAGGARAVKYGVTRDYVVSVELCLADGSLIRTGPVTAKGVAGYDLTRLVVGSEGTLGIVTEITLKLLPLPEASGAIAAFFPDIESSVACISSIFSKKVLPRCAEFLDRQSLLCASEKLPLDVPENCSSMLLIEVDGPLESIKTQLKTVQESCEQHNASTVYSPQNEKETSSLWAARRYVSPALKKLGFSDKISEDICVPRHALSDMMRKLMEIEKDFNVAIVTFGHAGDGNLHVNLLFNSSDPDSTSRADRAVSEIMREAVSLGGTISGEHGIGLSKLPFMEMEFTSAALDIMRRIKHSFDPKNIFNPHKMLPV